MANFKHSSEIILSILFLSIVSSASNDQQDDFQDRTTTENSEPRQNCTTTVSPDSGSVLDPSGKASITCTCFRHDKNPKFCPTWSFEKGQDYVIMEAQYYDSTNEYCSSIFKFRIKDDLKAGFDMVELHCKLPMSDDDNFKYEIQMHSPESQEWWDEVRRSELFIILSTICFILLTITVIGACFKCRTIVRRRNSPSNQRQRNTMARHSTSRSNPGFVIDNPPPYIQAINCPTPHTLPPSIMRTSFSAVIPSGESSFQSEKKLAKLAQSLKAHKVQGTSDPISKPEEP